MAQRHEVASRKELPPGGGRAYSVAGHRIALFNVEGRILAIDDTCPHSGAPLSEGTVSGTCVACPWHGAEFDLESGNVLSPPATEGVRSYPVRLDGDKIEVEL